MRVRGFTRAQGLGSLENLEGFIELPREREVVGNKHMSTPTFRATRQEVFEALVCLIRLPLLEITMRQLTVYDRSGITASPELLVMMDGLVATFKAKEDATQSRSPHKVVGIELEQFLKGPDTTAPSILTRTA